VRLLPLAVQVMTAASEVGRRNTTLQLIAAEVRITPENINVY
jgi:hypothetical protein